MCALNNFMLHPYRNYLDAATIGGVLSIYRKNKFDESHTWARITAMETTCALVNDTAQLGLAPYAGERRFPESLLKHTLVGLVSMVARPEIGDRDRESALKQTSQYIQDNIFLMRKNYYQLKTDNKYFLPWLEDLKENAWIDYANIYRGLIQERFIKDIASIMDIESKDLEKIASKCRNGSAVNKILTDRSCSDETLRVIKDGFSLSVILSGIFHDFIAKKKDLKIVLHPVRRPFLPKSNNIIKLAIKVPRVGSYLSCIILGNAFNARTPEERITVWSQSIQKAREVLSSQEGDLFKDYDSNDNAMREANRYAKSIGIHFNRYEYFIDVLIESTGFITSFTSLFNICSKTLGGSSLSNIINDKIKTSQIQKYARLMGVFERDIDEMEEYEKKNKEKLDN
jgi:hypothetical protein